MHGRNRLLELHSRGDDSVEPLIEAVLESDDDPSLEFYMEQVFNSYGVEEEELSENIVLIRPSTSLEQSSFPNLPEDGFSATFERNIALSREDIEFLSLDHPMVRNAMDMIITSGKGSSVMSLLKNKQIKEGTILLEALFIVECPAPAELQLGQLLPATPVRLLLDQQGRDISGAVTTDALDKQLKRVKGDLITPMLKEIQDPVLAMLQNGNNLMEQRKQTLVEKAQAQFSAYWENEKQRLQALSHLDDKEKAIDSVDKRLQKGLELLAKNSQYRLDGLRIMVTIS